MPRGLYPIGEGAGVGVVFFRLASGVQEPIFGKSKWWSGSLVVFYNLLQSATFQKHVECLTTAIQEN